MDIDIIQFFDKAQLELEPIYGSNESEALINWVVEDVLVMKRHQLKILNRKLSNEEIKQLTNIVNRLKQHEPIQYILGFAPFMHLRLKVNQSVLIPRPETEELVNLVINHFHSKSSASTVIDIGTGSGCIAIALAKSLSNSTVYAVDISTKALDIAKENALKQRANIHFVQRDFIADKDLFNNLQFDCIVSNPPYIKKSESVQMQKNVLAYEPHEALFVPDEDELIFYKHIVAFANERLKQGGFLAVEINQQLGDETYRLFEKSGMTHVNLIKDLSGNNRFITAQKA
jgi:release factor glutamine methyltransferase